MWNFQKCIHHAGLQIESAQVFNFKTPALRVVASQYLVVGMAVMLLLCCDDDDDDDDLGPVEVLFVFENKSEIVRQ